MIAKLHSLATHLLISLIISGSLLWASDNSNSPWLELFSFSLDRKTVHIFAKIQVHASSQTKGLERGWKRRARLSPHTLALRARKTLTPRFTDFFTDFEGKKTDCFAVYVFPKRFETGGDCILKVTQQCRWLYFEFRSLCGSTCLQASGIDIFDIFIQGLISSINLDKFFLWHEYLAYEYRTDLSLDLVICILFILFHFPAIDSHCDRAITCIVFHGSV